VQAKPTKVDRKLKPPQVFGKNGVFFTFPQGEGGPININIDFSLAPPPESYYYADAVHLRVNENLLMVSLSFGRRKVDTNNFQDWIEVVMPVAAVRQLSASTRDVEKAVDAVLKQMKTNLTTQTVSPVGPGGMTLYANMTFIVAGQGESSLDFYFLSPRDIHLAKTKKLDMQLMPVVRVIISTVVTKQFFGLIAALNSADQSSNGFPGRERATASRQ
jgi:hypothetical protein